MYRFFFHSFPRRRSGESREAQISKGKRIAKSLLSDGLVLCPENYELPLVGNDGITPDKLEATQRRICFTELEPDLLGAHSEVFGPFALAYTIEDLRRLGALPVFYIPLESGGYLSGLPLQLLGGIVDGHRITSTLAAIRKQLDQSPALGLKYRGKSVNFTESEASTIRTFVEVLMDSAATDFSVTDLRLAAAASCFYPTEDPKYTGPLHYYRQREWRIIQGLFTWKGESVSHLATPEQAAKLLEIDPDFFSKELSFFGGLEGVGAKVIDSIANRCHFLTRVGDLDAVGIARCLIIPDDAGETSELRAAFETRGVEVVRTSEVVRLGDERPSSARSHNAFGNSVGVTPTTRRNTCAKWLGLL